MPHLLRRRAALALSLISGLAGGYFATAQLPPLQATEPAFSSKRRDALVEIVEKVKGAVVNIHSERTISPPIDDPFRNAGSPLQMQRVNGMGTGIVLDPRGYIVTNFHVVDDIQVLRVRLVDGHQVSARVIATDKKADLALIKIDVPNPLPLATLGTAGDLFEAEQVIAIGNAFGYEHTVSIGHVAYKSRDVSLNKDISYQGLIQTTAPINPGNSGGPLFNKKGELVGVNVAIRAGAQNIAFAIPVDSMIDRATEMISVRKLNGVRHGLIMKDKVERPNDEGCVRRWSVVESVEVNSPAAVANLQPGDIVEKVGDVNVLTSIDVERGFLDRSGAVPITVKRGEKTLNLNVTLMTSARSSDPVQRRLGLRLSPVGKDAVAIADSQLRGGLTIVDVHGGGPAAKAGLQRGDIIIGFHLWEAVNNDNVLYMLNHKDLPTFSPVKTYFIREGKVRETSLTPAD